MLLTVGFGGFAAAFVPAFAGSARTDSACAMRAAPLLSGAPLFADRRGGRTGCLPAEPLGLARDVRLAGLRDRLLGALGVGAIDEHLGRAAVVLGRPGRRDADALQLRRDVVPELLHRDLDVWTAHAVVPLGRGDIRITHVIGREKVALAVHHP